MAMKLYTFTVSGEGSFPIVMLTVDACYPASQDDAVEISGSLYGRSTPRKRTITLRSRSFVPPNVDRWASWGWNVTDIRVLMK